MKREDHSPPLTPTIDQQRDALRKGLGRARRWAIAGKLDEEALLAACLENQIHDTQIEDPRGDWLWEMIREVGAVDRFRVPILHALYRLDDARNASQIVDLAYRYAKAGDETFRIRLREIVEAKPFPEMPWLAEEEIVRLEGQEGFAFAAKLRGRELLIDEWEWDFDGLINRATEQLGESETIRCLEDTNDPDLIRFREAWREQRDQEKPTDRDPRSSHRERMRAIPIEEILSTAAKSAGDRYFWYRGWGLFADEIDLETILESIWKAIEPRVIANLLKVFSGRPLTRFDSRLFELCRHPDSDVRLRAFSALESNAHPLVREFALAEMGSLPFQPGVVGLFKKNYEKGDEAKILEAIELPDEVNAIHWLLMDVAEVLENNADADCLPLALLTYATTPCQNCRHRAVQLLLGNRAAPAWLIEECRLDACSDIVAEISAHNRIAPD